jgi:hypothetical protein
MGNRSNFKINVKRFGNMEIFPDLYYTNLKSGYLY